MPVLSTTPRGVLLSNGFEVDSTGPDAVVNSPAPRSEPRLRGRVEDERQGVPLPDSTRAADPTRPSPTDEGPVHVAGMYSWTCRVVDVDEGSFSAEVVPDPGTPGDSALAHFAPDLLERPARLGDVFYVTTRFIDAGPGKVPVIHNSVTLRRLGRWQPEEVAEIRERARARAENIRRLIEQ